MDTQHALRWSILVALGAAGCAGANQSPPPGGDGNPVVDIPAPLSSAAANPAPDDDDPGLPRMSRIGWVTESNGSIHRGGAISCDPTNDLPACNGTEGRGSCQSDADCTAQPHGKCTSGMGQIGAYCRCVYSCATDADCGDGQACVCKGLGRVSREHSVCAKASCSKDADCPGSQCGLSVHNNGCSTTVSLACRTSADKCKADKDCPTNQCAVVPGEDGGSSEWACRFVSCAIGRPLVVEGTLRAADPTERNDWRGLVEMDVNALDPHLRSVAANHYLAVAAMEHASVASFSRFALQLMAFGAPADLLAEAHRAALDEIEHARMGYALASSFAGKNVGPDKLPAALANIPMDVESFVMALVQEGCVGETLGAAEGREAAFSATNPALAAMLSRIADDEERHAQLAWRSLQWALDAWGPAAKDAATRGFALAWATYAQDPVGQGASAEHLGILSAKNLGTLRRDVLSAVIEPCAQALDISLSELGPSA